MSALARRSPSFEIHLTKESFVSREMGKVMVGGFIYVFVLSVLLSVLLCGLAKAFERWTCRVQFCAFLGLIVALGDLAQAIWWHHAWGWTLVAAFYDLVRSTIAGLVLRKFVTPKAEPSTV